MPESAAHEVAIITSGVPVAAGGDVAPGCYNVFAFPKLRLGGGEQQNPDWTVTLSAFVQVKISILGI